MVSGAGRSELWRGDSGATLINEGRDCDPWESGDWTVFGGEPDFLLELADLKEQHARPGGGGSFDRRVARSLRQAVEDEHPEDD